MREKSGELCREQDCIYVSLLLEDLSGKLIQDSFKDMEDVSANGSKRISRKVDGKEYAAAEFLFNESSEVLLYKWALASYEISQEEKGTIAWRATSK